MIKRFFIPSAATQGMIFHKKFYYRFSIILKKQS